MGFYYTSLDDFDPVKGDVSWAPFREAPGIARRARFLLRGRSADEIKALAEELSEYIDFYFQEEKAHLIYRLKDEHRYDLLESDDDGSIWTLLPEAEQEYDLATEENTSLIEAATAVFESFEIVKNSGVQDPKEFEYCAAMALCVIGSYLRALDYTFHLKTLKYVKRKTKKYAPYEVSRFASLLIEAMEIVTYAESIKRENFVRQEAFKEIRRKGGVTSAEEFDAQYQERLKAESALSKEKAAEWGLEGKLKSMEPTLATKKACLDQWTSAPNLQALSNNKASLQIYAWLRGQDLEQVQPGTIAKWISEHKNAGGSSKLKKK